MTGRICGTGFCVPEHVMDNEELSRMVETSDEWIRERTGIEKRHIITDETTVSMAARRRNRRLKMREFRRSKWNSFLRQPYLPM